MAQVKHNRLTREAIFTRKVTTPEFDGLQSLLEAEKDLNPFTTAISHSFFVRRYIPSGRFPGKLRLFYQCIQTLTGNLCSMVALQNILGIG